MKEHGIPDRATLRLILTALPHNCAEDSSVHDAAAMIALAGDIDQMGPRFLDLLSGRSGWNSCMGNGAGEKSEEMGRLRVYGDLGTLYARCGGIFGIAAFMDCCMDKWMADATLSANAAVATWHERAQRCGFKFLITQLMCYLTGGPQRYTGRSMVQAHKHLNISCIEWRSFMKVFGSVCSELGLPALDAEDLAAILDSLEEECVVHHGEQVPPNPGRDVHVGKCLYSKLGGVYPLAIFADRLVDALIADSRVRFPVDGQKRNETSLKYSSPRWYTMPQADLGKSLRQSFRRRVC